MQRRTDLMKKQLIPVLIGLLVGMSAFVGSASGYSGRGISPAELNYSSDQMGNQPVKIYEKIGDVTFTHMSDTLTYHIYFGLAFPTINGSQKIVAYVYLLTDNQYITNSEVFLTYTIDIGFNGKNITRSGIVSDSTSFMLWGNEVYGFEMVGQNLASSEFPMTMDIALDYELSSTDLPSLSKTGVYTTSKYFLSAIMELWVLIVLICAAGAAVVIIIAVVVVRKKNKNRAPVTPTGEAIPTYTPAGGTGLTFIPPGGTGPSDTPPSGTENPYKPT
jgi:hypothetical protein